MNRPTLTRLFKTIVLLFVFCSCTEHKKPELPPPEVIPLPAVAPPVEVETAPPVAEVAPVAKLQGLAVLKKLKNRADMRLRDESVWQTAVSGSDFFRHDALQTHEVATAMIQYKSGSSLELKEKTLIIFDKDPGLTDRTSDRVLLKSGELIGTTKKELWVFTNAGLVLIKSRKNIPAQATLRINKERKLKVVVESGSADLILKKNDKSFQKFTLAEKADFEFTATVDFNVATDKSIEENNIGIIAKASGDIKNSTLAELVIDAPLDNASSTDEKYLVKGRLTELGAKLLVNGEPAEIANDLTFSKSILLTAGTNLVVFQLVRSDASVKFYRKTIRFSGTR